MVHKYDTERAVGLLRQYQDGLTSPEEQALKTSVGKVSAIFDSQLFHALLDIQECYQVTLQLNTDESGGMEEPAEATAENSGEAEGVTWSGEEEGVPRSGGEKGVTRVRVIGRRNTQRVEHVLGLVSRFHIETPQCPSSVLGETSMLCP
ncbi:hypothetical protein DPEC_G00028680 [Dallia pectoralis]|uniref:Uncharacterized protein n=1 Tax=Dallia pectoralis TaxID=75939 RepID=A0ACC2HJ73_DALPE|nr:hypothetical protein DPEC_G00028680 [Dallia pectoralis]